MSKLKDLTQHLAASEHAGHQFSCLPMPGDQEVLRVEVSELEEIPIFITVTDTQILCISYLLSKEEIHREKEAELNQYLLELNVPMPLSSFALIDNYYAIFGALNRSAQHDSVAQELVTLAKNSTDTLEALEDFIK